MIPQFGKTVFEIEEDDDMTKVAVLELYLADDCILGLFLWPKSWEWCWGGYDGYLSKGGYIFHMGPISFGYYKEPLEV